MKAKLLENKKKNYNFFLKLRNFHLCFWSKGKTGFGLHFEIKSQQRCSKSEKKISFFFFLEQQKQKIIARNVADGRLEEEEEID